MRGILSVSVLFALAAVVAAAAVKEQGYHATVGIPLAARLRRAEASGSRIIGGKPAQLGDHPYLVGMVVWMDFGQSVCGSTLLTNTRAITAAHCWYDGWRWARLLTMVFGSEYVFTGGVRVDTDQVDMHEDWTPSTLRNDVAIVSFPRVEFTDVIQPIALPSGRLLNSDFTGNLAFASGYGILSDSMGLSPNQVQSHVELEVISNDICRFRFGEFIFDSTICTSGVSVNGNVGICSSDSGGPLSTVEDGKRVLIGVSSFGSGVCEAGDPDGFSRVTFFVDWIKERI